ncbi:MAG: beta-ketoacyl-[acyl-carrier-protein] synthase family protein [bacterium]
MNKRIVITGVGVVSSIGIGKDIFWKNLLAGHSGISPVESFDTKDFPTHNGGEVKIFKPEEHLTKTQIKSMGRASQMAVVAARLALEDAGLDTQEVAKKDAGVIIGTTMADIRILEKINNLLLDNKENEINGNLAPKYSANNLSNTIAREIGIHGQSLSLPCACAAGNYSIGYASDLLKIGRAQLMLAGGADPFSRITFTGFNRLFAVAPEKCAPFDINRQGMIPGEGAGIIVLEPLDAAIKRGANIYAEVMGYGLSCDGYHMTKPEFSGILSSILLALKNAKIDVHHISYISAHGTGTYANDKTECLALKKIFGHYIQKIPVSSVKSMLGHTMGAASAIETIVCTLAIKNNCIPPTINYETPDPSCNIDCVPNVYREHEINIALNNGFAFGGNNACIVLKKY